jgi:hypothetical protein
MVDRVIYADDVREAVSAAVSAQPVTDIHTHLFSPEFGELLLWGVDELLTYHYLIAETLRSSDVGYDAYWAMSQREQADLVWKALFIENSPISEACRGVVTTLQAYGFDLATRDLDSYRDALRDVRVEDHIDRVFELANVESVVMTNDPFDPVEQPAWAADRAGDPRFLPALRIDPLLNAYSETGRPTLAALGYAADAALSANGLAEIRRFLDDWVTRMQPQYMAVSLPPDFAYPEDSERGTIIRECVLPVSRERNVPFAVMIGVKRAVNPRLRMAGDGMAKTDMSSLERLLELHPDNKILATLLSRENQHELCVIGRKFPNLLVFGCWWFMNNPSIIDEITRERIELLGLSVIPQHSDARILDQLVYKWPHSRAVIADVLADKYADLVESGWQLRQSELERDVAALLGGNFRKFLAR